MTNKSKKLVVIGVCLLCEIVFGLGAYFILKDMFLTGMTVGIGYCALFDFINTASKKE